MGSSGSPQAGPSMVGTLVLVIAAIAALFAVDTFLARIEKSESREEAQRLFEQGQQLARQGRSVEAIDRFRSSLSVSRGNPEVQAALAGSLLAVGRLTDAETLLREVLQRNATDGLANVIMARVLARQGRAVEAASYYHQAIYGRWKDNAAAHRVRVRFELVDLLVQEGDSREVLAEMLPLQDEAPDDLQTRKRIARLYLLAGSPQQAIELYREILRRESQDFDAYAGLGEAEFARGNYRTARTNFTTALRLRPADEEVAKRLGVCETVLSLDPTQRGLSTAERFRRSVRLVELTLEAMNRCLGSPPPEAAAELTGKAGAALKRRVSSARQDAVTETNLALAEQLWQARARECRQGPDDSEGPLALVIASLAQ